MKFYKATLILLSVLYGFFAVGIILLVNFSNNAFDGFGKTEDMSYWPVFLVAGGYYLYLWYLYDRYYEAEKWPKLKQFLLYFALPITYAFTSIYMMAFIGTAIEALS